MLEYLSYWQICEGNFSPRRTLGEPYWVTPDNYKDVAEDIARRSHQMICLMEDCTPEEFPMIRDTINNSLLKVLPDKCTFEK